MDRKERAMRVIRTILLWIALILAISSIALPVATAMATTRQQVAVFLHNAYAKQLRSRFSLNGAHLVSMQDRCAPAYDGAGDYTCYVQYIATMLGYHVEYGVYATVGAYSWHTQGKPSLIKEW